MEEFNKEEYEKYFKPTYLYIKQHKITGLKYFGKTIKNPLQYHGSGTRWKAHVQYHGKEHIETVWYQLFEDIEECRNYALKFSIDNNIVESNEWANLIPEDGLWISPETRKKMGEKSIGNTYRRGKTHTTEANEKNRIAHTGKKQSQETIDKRRESSAGYITTEDTKEKIRKTLTGVKHTEERKKKNSESNMGRESPMKGKSHTEEANEKNRQAHIGKKDTPEAIANKRASQLDPVTRENNRQKHLGKKHTDEARAAISAAGIGRECTEETREKLRIINTGKKMSAESNAKNSASRMGKGTGKRDTCECPHCGVIGGVGMMKRYHFDNCLNNPDRVESIDYIDVTCPHCGKTGRGVAMKRWHFDNCRTLSINTI